MFYYVPILLKKTRGNQSGPRALSAPKSKVDFFNSSLEKGVSNRDRSIGGLFFSKVDQEHLL